MDLGVEEAGRRQGENQEAEELTRPWPTASRLARPVERPGTLSIIAVRSTAQQAITR